MSLSLYRNFSDWFWDHSFWLPTNYTWEDLRRDSSGIPFYPDVHDLAIALPLAVGLFVARLLWERFIALPVGRYFKVRETVPTRAVNNEVLEKAFRSYGKLLPKHSVVLGIAKQTDFTPRQIERWWQRRKSHGKLSEMQRFRETSWRCIFYLVAFWSGLYVLWDKPWLWDTRHCWYGCPLQHVSSDIWWYYMLELSFYCSLVLSLFMDTKRKDFGQMMVHHIATLSLIWLSWSANCVRIGSLVFCVHDAIDYILEGTKLALYCKCSKVRDVLFAVLTVGWPLTRLGFFPYRVLYSTLVEGPEIIGEWTSAYVCCNLLLGILQVLHVMWCYFLLKLVYTYVVKGTIEKDERSDTEMEETNSEDEVLTEKCAQSKLSPSHQKR